ncbi:MAG: thiolase C-terminal domain-containing protein [Acidimicrobiales bacterium]
MNRAAITGVGYTTLSRDSGRGVLELAAEACRNAIDDAGLVASDVDGVGSFMLMHDSAPCIAVSTALGLPALRWTVDLQLGGQAPCHLVGLAAAAIATGSADHIVLYRALNGRSGARVGTMQFDGLAAQYRYPIGYDSYLMYVAMWAQRFLHETGGTPDDLGVVPLAQRPFACRNERALRRDPLDRDAYLAQPFVVEPFRAADCTIEVDGACAVVVSALDRARDLRHPPAVVASTAYRAGRHPGLDIGDHLLSEDYSRNYSSDLAAELYRKAGLGPEDVEFAELYDCFSSTALMSLEGLGLCRRGEAAGFVGDGGTAVDGRLPMNTNGGLLAEGYLHGMNTVAEAVLQIQRRGGDRQVRRADVGVVTSGALMEGSALVLTADH